MRWVLLVTLAACRSQSSSPVPPPSPARIAHVPPPAPTLAVEPPLVEELPWVDPDEPKVGAIAGVIVDTKGEPLPGATIIVTSDGLPMSQSAISEDDGGYIIEDLPPDDYLLTLYYVEHTEEHHVTVGDDVAELSVTLDPDSFTPTFIGCGGGMIENTYVVDGIDASGLTFDE